MTQTPAGLLERACRHRDFESWQRLMKVVSPFLLDWLVSQGVRKADADDIVQDVLMEVAKGIGSFRRDGAVSFQAWLRKILVNRLQRFVRMKHGAVETNGHGPLPPGLLDLDDSVELGRRWEEEYDVSVTRGLAELVQERVSDATWQAFRRTVLEGESIDVAAEHLGMSPNAVVAARSRFLHDLRREGRGLLKLE